MGNHTSIEAGYSFAAQALARYPSTSTVLGCPPYLDGGKRQGNTYIAFAVKAGSVVSRREVPVCWPRLCRKAGYDQYPGYSEGRPDFESCAVTRDETGKARELQQLWGPKRDLKELPMLRFSMFQDFTAC